MRFKRIIALLCAAIYIFISGAAAAELPQTMLSEEAEQITEAELQTAADLPAARATTVKVVPSTHHVEVNGKEVNPQAYNIGGYNYFKLRDLAYLLNGTTMSFNVTWDSANKAVNMISGQAYTIVGGEMTVASTTSLRVQESTAKVLLNGSSVSIKGYSINGNNYYKIADVSSAIGFTAAYESASKTVQIITPPAAEPEPEQPDEPFVTGIYQVKVDSSLSIRSGPGTSYAIVGQLSNGAQIIVDELTNGWAHIKNTSGYCSADYLTRMQDYTDDAEEEQPEQPDESEEPDESEQPDEPDEPDEPEEPFVTGVYRVEVESSLSVRSGPGTSYNIVGRLQNGDEIVVDGIEDGWAHLMDTSVGSGRYCSLDYLTRIGDYDLSQGEPEDPVDPPRTSHLDGKMTVILDAGHGGSDIGAHNEDMSLDEKHVNLYVAQYLQAYLEDAGVNVIMVRDTMEEGNSLSLRGTVMEQYASSVDLFFSVHHNAANTTARGAEVLAQIADKNGGPSKILGEALLEEYSALGIPIRQVVFKEGNNGDYYYTNRVAASLFIPAVTSEFCFIDNEEDQTFIDSEEDWQAEARAQYNAIMYYFTQVEY